MSLDYPEACRIRWSSARAVTFADGDCLRVLGREAGKLVGQPLSLVLGVPERRAVSVDHKARHDEGGVEFVSARPLNEATVLRLSVGTLNGDAFAWVMDMHALVAGAPPLQIARLASSLSHEIRNPLSSVKMAVQTLARNAGLSDRDKRRLAIANREIRTMERMLGLLSEYGRDVLPAREQIPLRALIQDALSVIEPELAERRIRVEIDEPAHLPRIGVDVHRLRLVLAQFLLNVAMGLPEDSSLPVTLRPGPDGGASMAVRDPSAIIPPEERTTLFEPFGSRLARGAGLSLAALRRVLQSQGGDVSAESLSEQGACFTLSFPM
jgi:two-component system, NtrC family, sensor histidine kinase HydH